MASQSPNEDSFIKKQLKLGSSTIVVTSVASFVLVLWWVIIPTIIMFIMVISMATIFGAAPPEEDNPIGYTKRIYGQGFDDNKFLALPINGVIEGSKNNGGLADVLFGGMPYTYGYELKDQLVQAANEEYKGVILEVDSPGGTIFGSKAIADGVEYYRKKTGNPVYVHVQNMAASGAYLASASATKIYADSGTATGSIGVIFGPIQFFDKPIALDNGILGGGIVTQNGVEQQYITAGTGKDAGNPFRRLTEQEKSIYQQSVNDAYASFVKHVAIKRKITESKLRDEIGAHIYGEQQALALGLIDQISDKQTVYNDIAKAAGIKDGQFSIVAPDSSSGGLAGLLGAKVRSLLNGVPGNDVRQTNASSLPRVCTENVTPLVYHGDIVAICTK